MKKFARFGFFALILSSGLSLADSNRDLDSVLGLPSYPSSNCNVRSALADIKAKYANFKPFGEGNTGPWPGVYGVWTQVERGIYLVLFQETTNKETRLYAKIHSICSNRLWAQGTRKMTAEDWNRTGLILHVQTADSSHYNLAIYARDPDPSSKVKNNLEVFFFGKEPSSSKPVMLDGFNASKL